MPVRAPITRIFRQRGDPIANAQTSPELAALPRARARGPGRRSPRGHAELAGGHPRPALIPNDGAWQARGGAHNTGQICATAGHRLPSAGDLVSRRPFWAPPPWRGSSRAPIETPTPAGGLLPLLEPAVGGTESGQGRSAHPRSTRGLDGVRRGTSSVFHPQASVVLAVCSKARSFGGHGRSRLNRSDPTTSSFPGDGRHGRPCSMAVHRTASTLPRPPRALRLHHHPPCRIPRPTRARAAPAFPAQDGVAAGTSATACARGARHLPAPSAFYRSPLDITPRGFQEQIARDRPAREGGAGRLRRLDSN